MKKTALIVAGGTGTRMKAGIPKQFLVLKDKPVLIHTVRLFLDFDPELMIGLVLHDSCFTLWEKAAQKFLNDQERKRVFLCPGGKERTDSVHLGLQTLYTQIGNDNTTSLVAIHDGVRPLATPALLHRSYTSAAEYGASVACVPVTSSLRKNQKDGSSTPVDRSLYYEVQTPQTFYLDRILACYDQRGNTKYTDDASLYEAAGNKVVICEGEYENIKLTTPIDLLIAEKML